jgi:hypothetical protein
MNPSYDTIDPLVSVAPDDSRSYLEVIPENPDSDFPDLKSTVVQKIAKH